MRVIAGRYGGRRLTAPRGRTTRPTSDMVREALFAMLGDVRGARVLDLFAGTGALGIEALSRGALLTVFVERDQAAIIALRANLAALGLDETRALVRREDAVEAMRMAQKRKETYDLILIDPPYARTRRPIADRWGRELSAQLPALLNPGARVVLESERRMPLALDWAPEKERSYGDTEIGIYRVP